MSTGRWAKRGLAFQAWADAGWALAGSGDGGTIADPLFTQRIRLIGTSLQRTAIQGTSLERNRVIGTSKEVVRLHGNLQ